MWESDEAISGGAHMISAVLLKDRLKKQTMAGENSALQAFERAEEAFAGEASP